jgi:hypothetical protein
MRFLFPSIAVDNPTPWVNNDGEGHAMRNAETLRWFLAY